MSPYGGKEASISGLGHAIIDYAGTFRVEELIQDISLRNILKIDYSSASWEFIFRLELEIGHLLLLLISAIRYFRYMSQCLNSALSHQQGKAPETFTLFSIVFIALTIFTEYRYTKKSD